MKPYFFLDKNNQQQGPVTFVTPVTHVTFVTHDSFASSA